MKFDQKKFLAQIPASFGDVYPALRSYGFIPTLVGGTVRDVLLRGQVGTDWDIELTHTSVAFSKESWKDLGKDLSRLGRVSYLSYEILRLDMKDVQYEFSPPRKEVFGADWETSGHSNFVAEFDFKFSFEDSVSRRDFTINAMGIRFLDHTEFEFLDPLGGLVHLREKRLHHCGENFQKDPVRFLRALRFSQKLGFSFSPELKSILLRMPVGQVSANYLWQEMQKSGNPLTYLKNLTDWQVHRPELRLPLETQNFSQKWEELERVLKDQTKHETWIIALEWMGVSSSSWQKFFQVSSETSIRLGRWAESSKNFIQMKPEMLHGEFEAVRGKSEFALVFDWYFTTKQLLQKNPELPLLKMIEEYLPDWIHLYRFEVVKDVKHIDPPFRAKYQVWNLCQRL